jgi:hypothetical protein
MYDIPVETISVDLVGYFTFQCIFCLISSHGPLLSPICGTRIE